MADRLEPTKNFSARLSHAQRWRNDERPFIEEIFSFCCPGREYDFQRSTSTTDYDTQTYVSVPEELATDLAGDLVTYFTPAEAKWAEFLVTDEIPEEALAELRPLLEQREKKLFDLIQASNYNDIAPQWAFEAATHGTAALWVEASHTTQPIFIESVPPSDLLIVPGHLGILDRFRQSLVMTDTLPALFDRWDEVNLNQPQIQKKMLKPGQRSTVIWGFWVDWKDPGNPRWRCEITIDGSRVTPKEPIDLGPLAGSVPLLVGRFNPQPKRPWGRGAGRKALPDMRVWNKVDETILNGLDQTLMNTLIYPNDGVLDLSEGLEPGRSYAAGPRFDKNSVLDLSREVNLDAGHLTAELFENRLRTAFYQDGPKQTGDTPPTAAQWIDERRRVQQRLGKPSAPLWTELFVPFIQRIEKLGVDLGIFQAEVTHNGQALTLLPISPLQKAQNQDKVMVARSNLALAEQVMPNEAGTIIDMVATFKNVVRASGDELTEVRDQPLAPAAPPQGTPPNASPNPAQ